MKVLITGGLGFLGCSLAIKLAEQNHKVIVVDYKEIEKNDQQAIRLIENRNVQFFKINLLNESLEKTNLGDIDCVVHLAALLGVENVINNPMDTLNVNYKLLDNAITIKNPHKKIKFLFASTSEVYAEAVEQGTAEIPTKESSELVLPKLEYARTSYMLSKVYGECLTLNSSHAPIIIRPHNLYGPRMGMKHVVPQIIDRIRKTPSNGELIVYSPGHTRTFCYINDAVEQIYALISSDNLDEKIFNIGSKEPEIKIADLVKLIAKLLNREDITFVDGEVTPGSPVRRCPDTSRIDKILGTTERTKLENGLKSTIEYYIEN